MEFKGTKGKWGLLKGNKDKFTKIIIGENKILEFQYKTEEFEVEIYDALLISKAPEMLEMLEEFEKNLRSGYVINKNKLNEIQQLIKEATQI